MNNPHQALVDWLKTIDNSNLLDIAYLLSSSPYFSVISDQHLEQDEIIEKFWEIVDSYSESSFKSAAFLVSFKALFDFYFESRLSEEGWKEVEDRHERMLKLPELTPSMEAHLNRMISLLPDRKKAWIGFSDRWNSLKNNELSSQSLLQWTQNK
ncbi:hypothetical protein [Acinetobacter soli]|uniref:hypothetical protein n=1 Tax=Acinetobacter soli TaxID=487316 RepID=UPI0012508392|nr:hypothetical protein [Acinetobacter soli]MBV6549936.1 hypothetical protein [Acinetobacter soli]